jgi:hypothetical protein
MLDLCRGIAYGVKGLIAIMKGSCYLTCTLFFVGYLCDLLSIQNAINNRSRNNSTENIPLASIVSLPSDKG